MHCHQCTFMCGNMALASAFSAAVIGLDFFGGMGTAIVSAPGLSLPCGTCSDTNS